MSEKHNVVMANLSGRGGISQYSYCLAKALARQGLDLLYLVPQRYEFSSWDHPFPVKVSFEPLFDKGSPYKKAITHLRNIHRLKRELKASRPQICHLHEAKLPWVDRKLLRWCHREGIALIYTAHNVLHHERQPGKGSLRDFYQHVDGIIAHAERNKQELCEIFGVEEDAVTVIPHGNYTFYSEHSELHESHRASARRVLGLDPSLPVVLFFGHIRAYKGLDILLEAVRHLQQLGVVFNLVIAGDCVENFGKYQRMIENLENPERIQTHLQYIPEDKVSAYFVAADIVVLPYRRIYQSGVVQLAYAYGRPVVATSVGGIPEVVEHGRTGLLVAPNDSEALSEALANMLRDPKLTSQMGEFAYELAQTKYSWDAIAELTIKLYQRVLDGRVNRRNEAASESIELV